MEQAELTCVVAAILTTALQASDEKAAVQRYQRILQELRKHGVSADAGMVQASGD